MDNSIADSALRKASRRLIPFLCILYFISYVDRINVGFAALTMNRSLGLSGAEFGFAASLFFVGYFLFEIPSNLILVRVGAGKWIGRIMITWGLASAATAFSTGADGLYVTRFLLGVAEAGFFPGLMVYLSQWFPAAQRARMIGWFMIAIPLSGVIGAPLSSSLLSAFDGMAGLAGWQWLFVLEGIPAVIAGLICFRYLTPRPAVATWLTAEERDWLEGQLETERQVFESIRKYSLLGGLTNRGVVLLSVLFFLIVCGSYGSGFWLPQIVRSLGVSVGAVGIITAIPFLAGAIAMLLWSRHSDAKSERTWHMIIPVAVSAIGFFIAAIWLATPVLAVAGLTIAYLGICAATPIFWTLPVSFLTGIAAAGALALINSVANIAGILAPVLIGWSHDVTKGFTLGISGMGVALLLAVPVAACFGAWSRARIHAPRGVGAAFEAANPTVQ